MRLTVQQYRLRLENGSYTLLQGREECSFSPPASTRGVAKLYTLSRRTQLIYVGIAKQPMSARIRYGLTADGKKGYHGYKWKGINATFDLNVWTGQVRGRYVPLDEMETIEAEVAFLCRERTGQWPRYQHEIHFFQSLKRHRDAASLIYAASC